MSQPDQPWYAVLSGIGWHFIANHYGWVVVVSGIGFVVRKYQMRITKEQRRFFEAAKAANASFVTIDVPKVVEELADRMTYRWASLMVLVRDIYIKYSWEDGIFAYEIAPGPHGPWVPLTSLIDVRRSFGEIDGPDQLEFLPRNARAHAERWEDARRALAKNYESWRIARESVGARA